MVFIKRGFFFVHSHKENLFFIFPFKHWWKKQNQVYFYFIFCTHCVRKIELNGCIRGNFSGHLILLGNNKVQHSNKIK